MADKITNISILPELREENRYASTNITNQIVSSLGKLSLAENRGFIGRNRAYIAKITGTTGCANGYYNAEIYERAPTICNPTTALTSAKLCGTKIGEGYVYNPPEADAGTHGLTDASNGLAKLYRVYFDGQYHSDKKPVLELNGGGFGGEACS